MDLKSPELLFTLKCLFNSILNAFYYISIGESLIQDWDLLGNLPNLNYSTLETGCASYFLNHRQEKNHSLLTIS